MARFEVESSEGMRWVRVDLKNDDVRTERGALNHMKGTIALDVPFPTLKTWWVSLFSDESPLRPRYHGTGSVWLDSTLGGYHVMTIKPGDRWILDGKCFWSTSSPDARRASPRRRWPRSTCRRGSTGRPA